MIHISDRAAQRINGLVESKPDHGLRVKVVGGGCSGLTYKMEIDLPKDHDKIFENNGAKVFVDRKSFLYLVNTTLDYQDDLMSSGFVFGNPNAKRSCGCGSSFTV